MDPNHEHPADDPADEEDLDRTAVRPALADDLLEPRTYDDDDFVADEELLGPDRRRPSLVTRILLALLVCGVGILIGVQLALASGSAAGAAGATGASRAGRFGPPGASPTGAGPAPSRSTPGSSVPAAQGEVTSVRAHTLVLLDQGASATVTFTDDTTVTKPYGRGALGAGDAVTVFGSRAADGTVNATSIVVR